MSVILHSDFYGDVRVASASCLACISNWRFDRCNDCEFTNDFKSTAASALIDLDVGNRTYNARRYDPSEEWDL